MEYMRGIMTVQPRKTVLLAIHNYCRPLLEDDPEERLNSGVSQSPFVGRLK